MQLKPKNQCPLNNFEPCKQLECAWFMKIQGKCKNTGADVEEWGCAIAWLPSLLIENAGVGRETGAAVESFRNEMAKSNNVANQVLGTLLMKNAEAMAYYKDQGQPMYITEDGA